MSASRQLRGTCPVFQLLLKIPRSLDFALVFQHLIVNFIGASRLLVLQAFQGLLKLLCIKWAAHVFWLILISLVVLDFIMFFLRPVVWYDDVADLFISVYEAICFSFPCHCLLVSLKHDR